MHVIRDMIIGTNEIFGRDFCFRRRKSKINLVAACIYSATGNKVL